MNKLAVAISGLAIVAVIALILGITLTTDRRRNGDKLPYVSKSGEPITFDEFLSYEFSAKSFNGSWFSNNQIQWRDKENNLVLWNVNTNETTILVGADTVGQVSKTAQFVDFAPKDNSKLLFYDNKKSVWRHSFLANYLILDSKTNETKHIIPKGLTEPTKLQYCQWVPETSWIIFVFENNVYLRKDAYNQEADMQLSKDGVVDTIYNGIPDWVYEEEILSTNKAMYFNNDGNRLAFARFNDTNVREFYYTRYGEPSDPLKVQYPQQILLKYPKVGTPNPTINLFVVNLEANAENMVLEPVIPPEEMSTREHIFTAVTWISNDKLSVIWTNRVQNESSVSVCEANNNSWKCTTKTSPYQNDGWLDVFQPPKYSKDGNSFLQILPMKVGELHYPHIKFHNENDAKFITSGKFVVTSILIWNEEDSKVYFIGTGESSSVGPGSRHLYVAKTDTNVEVDCITCKLLTQRNQECLLNSILMSPDGQHYVHTCQGPNIPEIVLRTVKNNTHEVKYIFELNEDLEEKLENKSVSERMDLTVTVGEDYEAPVVMSLPKDYDPNRKYPLLLYVYGGPGSQLVNQAWKVGWTDYLTSNYGVVYATIDGRGTGFQSNEYKFEVYHKLGTVEMIDQIEAAKQLLEKFEFLDASRVAIWGWSYGGYATAMTLIKDEENVFKCGISTAPPTNWLFYDSMYTERFMGLPTEEDNLIGYQNGSLLDKVTKLKDKKFQLNHGVADDNVHYQQSMLFMRALELENIDFEQNTYPEENHSLGGVKRAVYHNFDQFWAECFV